MQLCDSKYFARTPAPHTHYRGQKFNTQLYQNDFMLHIKLKGITNAATW